MFKNSDNIMNLHEYQAKKILQEYRLPIHDYRVVSRLSEVYAALEALNVTQAMVKAQIHSGGRGKVGGVKKADSCMEIFQEISRMLGREFITKQTGHSGLICQKVLITGVAQIVKEYYLGLIIDRTSGLPLLMLSAEGGMDIEETSSHRPEAIFRAHISLDGEIAEEVLEKIGDDFHWNEGERKEGFILIKTLCRVFVEKDATTLEINPLIQDEKGSFWILDAKIIVDDNALFRQPEIAAMYDYSQQNEQEAMAHDLGLSYIGLDGNIACVVNGAGLAMATMDLIQLHGGQPANFLDIGGNANVQQMTQSLALVFSDTRVRSVLVNIFGGIVQCDLVAESIIAALQDRTVRVPIIVRLEGTRVKQGKLLLQNSSHALVTADDLTDAAKKAVEYANSC